MGLRGVDAGGNAARSGEGGDLVEYLDKRRGKDVGVGGFALTQEWRMGAEMAE